MSSGVYVKMDQPFFQSAEEIGTKMKAGPTFWKGVVFRINAHFYGVSCLA